MTLTGVFAAFIATSIARLLDRGVASLLEGTALCALLVSLGILSVTALLLGRSALARSYEVIATPSAWVGYLAKLKEGPHRRKEIYFQLRHDILDAWIRACDACFATNEAKAGVLEKVSKSLCVAIVVAFAAVCLLVWRSLIS